MATQIHAVPDENGIIHIACGGDILEIVVMPRDADPGDRETGSDDPYAAIRYRASGGGMDWLTLIDEPYVFAVPGAKAKKHLGQIDVDSILRKITADMPSGGNGPSGVMLNVDTALDLHEIRRLSLGLGKTAPGLGLAVNFGKRRG